MKTHVQKIALLGLIVMISLQVSAQENQKEKTSFWQKLRPGGSIGASFSDPIFVNISPLLGYQATANFQLGLGATYLYQNPSGFSPQHNYGGRGYGQYQVYKPFFIWAELEALNVEEVLPDGITVRNWQWAPLLGGGLQLSLGNRGNIYINVLYNLNHNQESWRASPWETRIGFGF